MLFGEIAIKLSFISQAQLREANYCQQATHSKIGEIMIQRGFLDEDQVLLIISKQRGLKIVDLDKIKIPKKVAGFEGVIAMLYRVIPLGRKDGH